MFGFSKKNKHNLDLASAMLKFTDGEPEYWNAWKKVLLHPSIQAGCSQIVMLYSSPLSHPTKPFF